MSRRWTLALPAAMCLIALGVSLAVALTVPSHLFAAAPSARPQEPAVPAAPAADSAAAAAAPPSALVFEGTTVIDVRDGRKRAKQSVVVVGNRIAAVGPVGRVRVPAGATVLQAHGTYAIPGLWDMHAHPYGFATETFYPLFIANGVTGIREMSTAFLDSVRRWRTEIAAGTRVGPRVVTAGPVVMSDKEARFWKTHPWAIARGGGAVLAVGVATPADARRVVDSLKRAGADFIKVRDDLPRALYFAVARAARELGLPFAGHQPASITAEEAIDSGQRSLEHGIKCRRADWSPAADSGPPVPTCAAIAAKMRRHDAWYSDGYGGYCSVVTACDVQRFWPDSIWGADTGAQYEQVSVQRLGASGPARSVAAFASYGDDSAASRRHWAHAAGIRMLAGTDTGPEGMSFPILPGFSVHDQLWYFARQGLTPLEALQTATLNPALYFRATDSLGTVAAGRLADFVLLDADPLADIYNTRRIRAVVANGRLYDRADLDRLLYDAEQVARRSVRKP